MKAQDPDYNPLKTKEVIEKSTPAPSTDLVPQLFLDKHWPNTGYPENLNQFKQNYIPQVLDDKVIGYRSKFNRKYINIDEAVKILNQPPSSAFNKIYEQFTGN